MLSRVESKQNPQCAAVGDSKLFHVRMSRCCDFPDYGSLQIRTQVDEQRHSGVERFLLILTEPRPPEVELVCVLDLPHQ